MADLIIVESPSKAKTLKNYLGSGYNIVASKGHIRDLPAARLSVDVKNDFAPKYNIVKEQNNGQKIIYKCYTRKQQKKITPLEISSWYL